MLKSTVMMYCQKTVDMSYGFCSSEVMTDNSRTIHRLYCIIVLWWLLS